MGFYEDLYNELGKLFYHIAASDGNVEDVEKESLSKLIKSNWIPMESSTDNFGTDQANLINFSFEYQEAEGHSDAYMESFEFFYDLNKDKFSSEIKDNILKTGQAIAESYRGKNQAEKAVLVQLRKIFKKK